MELLYEKSKAGRRAATLPRHGLPAAGCPRGAPPRRAAASAGARRARARPPLHELSTRNFGIDTGFYPLGCCTMKHNPKVNERVVMLPGFKDLHPQQEEDGAQGALELMWRLQEILKEVAGLDACSLQPAAGFAGRADRPDADARLFRGPRRGRAAGHDHHRRHSARHQPGERDDGGLQARGGRHRSRGGTSTSTTCERR